MKTNHTRSCTRKYQPRQKVSAGQRVQYGVLVFSKASMYSLCKRSRRREEQSITMFLVFLAFRHGHEERTRCADSKRTHGLSQGTKERRDGRPHLHTQLTVQCDDGRLPTANYQHRPSKTAQYSTHKSRLSNVQHVQRCCTET